MKELINKLIAAGIDKQEAKKEISILYKELGGNNLSEINKIVLERIKTRTPIQYLLGKAYFMDFEVKVNKKVLIPRPETEILVEETVKKINNCHSQLDWESRQLINKSKNWIPTSVGMTLTALDIGTGSGIIAIALAKLIPSIKITAIDVEKEIIDLAQENAAKNNVSEKINFKVCDLFSKHTEELFKKNKFNLIISNPPYVKNETANQQDDKTIRQPEIEHEPKIALHGSKENKSGLIYYERIIELIIGRGLSRQAPVMLAFEVDPPLVHDLKSLLKKEGLNNFEIIKDYAGLERCLFISL
ncbi:MAG: peptide chain release factor N(5)-glutamine methyltransferase [Candidatus Melainabacteria bacterium]|nr:peptide chain release factor N(5)-glutamine methyltransferase [Candidatus Melainabacteria bacterium]